MARIFVSSELEWARFFRRGEFRILVRLGNALDYGANKVRMLFSSET